MKKLLSICIPTMNRPDWLLQAINSILASNLFLERIEICISNNCSERDYSEVERRIESASNLCKICYVRHDLRITLDENHHYVKKMSNGEYVYFLGDDDYFLKGQIAKLFDFIEAEKPDLAIFNGLLVDGNNNYLGRHFNLPSKEYLSLDAAFMDLRDKGMFGAVLVRRDFLQDEDFSNLYGTSHGYGCYWFSILKKYEQSLGVRIFIPDFPCVALRCSEKNYNHIYVYYRDIPYETAVFKRFAQPGEAQRLIARFEQMLNTRISSFRFMCALSDFGCDLSLIKTINPVFYSKYSLRIKFARVISRSKIYKIIKDCYRMGKERLKIYSTKSFQTEDINLITSSQ
ncbi:abequosyltransferase RfbV [mine drainage metagenome]|uniref:Abequosyltransferase RfbV n=1 Tax=mine drainage metagenome TaxID=410659 RepID=A0A1J5SZJ6_9ZZZZ